MTRVVRVLPGGPIDKTFDYLVPDDHGDQVRVGTPVRAPLHGRRVGGWVVEADAEPPAGVELRPLSRISGVGPPPDLVDLAGWAAWRWAGRRASFLGTASPDRIVRSLPPPARPGAPVPGVADRLVRAALERRRAVVRLPPAADPYPVALGAASHGNTLVLAPSVAAARRLGLRLRRAGVPVALHPRDWAQGAAGATVVGARAAAWAPVADLAAVVVVDEHDEAYQEERSPTWHARDVVVERARRAGIPCVLVSPAPTLEAQAWGEVLAPSRADERSGWPVLDVVDRRRDDPRTGLYSERLVRLVRGPGRVVCVLNRTGRARLLACATCGELARCERCQAAVEQAGDESGLVCRRCGSVRPSVCAACGSTRLRTLRVGVTRAREDLARLAGEEVVEVTAASGDDLPAARLFVGTEAALHRLPEADAVAFLEFDQELLAPRYRAAEQALVLLVRAARLVGGRSGKGRVLVQTRLPGHEVIDAALHGDPSRLSSAELERREVLAFPPCSALALVSGPSGAAFIESFGSPDGVEVLGPSDGRWLLRAPDHATLCDALAVTPRPAGRLRIEVDPLRV